MTPEPRRNIVAGEPVKLRVKALDVLLRPWFAYGPHRGDQAGVRTSGRARSDAPSDSIAAPIRLVTLPAWPGRDASQPARKFAASAVNTMTTSGPVGEPPNPRSLRIDSLNRVMPE